MIAKGYFKTPAKIVGHMVSKLFEKRSPTSTDTILDTGCGPGDFIEGIVQWCKKRNIPLPKIKGVELDSKLASIAQNKFKGYPEITIEQSDYLTTSDDKFDFIIGNPPYVSILQLTEDEKRLYKPLYKTAIGRFDLYLLFFEKSTKLLREGGRLVYITPEKYTYVETAKPLRKMLTTMQVSEIEFLDEDSFSNLTTYPTITIIDNSSSSNETIASYRDGTSKTVMLPIDGEKWLPILNGHIQISTGHKLEDICIRISCGVATGADEVFIRRTSTLKQDITRYAYPTIAGRELTNQKGLLNSPFSMLVPYDDNGKLFPFEKLGALGQYLSQPHITKRLKKRTCCGKKPWYAFHETPPMKDMLRPKILCKDITAEPDFWLDREGKFVPRHSVYYIVPKEAGMIQALYDYLKTEFARDWLEKNCQKAANNFLRLQSSVLKDLPIPEELYTSQNNEDPQ